MSKWLIIGDTSFTGSHFLDYLRDLGETVTGASLRNGIALGLLTENSWDYVVNFAALNVVAPSWDHPADYYRVNVWEQIPLFEEMRLHPALKYLHVSTPEVYGSTPYLVSESYRHNPSTPYAASRSAAEQLLLCYHRQYGLPVVFSRAANVYGPKQQLYRMLPKLIWHIEKGICFPLEGGGKSVRSWLHVRDACAGLKILAELGTAGQAYHISTPFTYRIHDLAQAVCRAMGVNFLDAVDTNIPGRPGKDLAYSLDTRAIEALGWQPTIDSQTGIREVVRWVRNNWDQLKDQSTDYVFEP